MIQQEKIYDSNRVGIFFWILFSVNYLVMGLIRYVSLPVPTSLFVEFFYIITIIHVCANNKKYGDTIERAFGPMSGIYCFWLIYAILEICNTTSEIDYGTIAYRWFAEIRNMAFQVIYGFIIFATIFNTKEKIKKLHKFWGILVVLAVSKGLVQQYLGFDHAEHAFLATAAKTHLVNGIIRYFSFFSDAANYGSNMAATAVVYFALASTTTEKNTRKLYFVVMTLSLYGMMASGTRSAIISLAVGLMTYILLSKNIKAFISTSIFGICTIGLLMFTNIGQGNNMIRRMRSAFDKNDASLGARETNKIAMQRYLAEAPIGIGAGIQGGDIPMSNRHYFLSVVPPDSTWVYVNIHYGHIGKFFFLFSFFGISLYGSYIVFSKIKDPEVKGQMSAIVSGALSMTVAGYSNQIMLQYPNCLLFFGTLGIISVADIIDKKAIDQKYKELQDSIEQ